MKMIAYDVPLVMDITLYESIYAQYSLKSTKYKYYIGLFPIQLAKAEIH